MKLLKTRKLIILTIFATLLLMWEPSYTYGCKWLYESILACFGTDDTDCPSCVESHWRNPRDCEDRSLREYSNHVFRCKSDTIGSDHCDRWYEVVFCRKEATCANGTVRGGYCCSPDTSFPPWWDWDEETGCWQYGVACVWYDCVVCSGAGSWEIIEEWTARCYDD
jgi:hypothetical protein